ncbi:hypothetical protein H5T51_04440 [Candidatus Bathyarchaeota archaeon]|nr:hypothetical protein [Candidatus Bathyarchaeota archaeon]
MHKLIKIKNKAADRLFPYLYLTIFAFSLALFPAQIVQGNTTINIFIHYAGFVFGIATA